MDNGVVCSLLWTHMCVRTNNTLKPCCRFQSNNPTNEFKETIDSVEANGINALNSEYFKNIRQKMLAGEKIDGCIKCYAEENIADSSKLSMRQYYNKNAESLFDSNLTTNFDSVRYIEMSIDNICNLQCKMCDSKFSSKLQNRDKFLNNTVHKKLEPNFTKLKNLDLSNLSLVKILGGEPFITPNFEKFLDFLNEKSDPSKITLDIISNGTSMPSASIIKKLEKFENSWISISLDSYNKSNDYQRFGSNYLKIYENAVKYQQILKNLEISFHITTSVLTANHLAHTLDFLTNEGYRYSVDFVRDPPYLSILNSPTLFLEWILEKNKNNAVATSMLKNIAIEHKFDKAEWEKFLNINKKLDNYYKTNLKDYNSELFQFLNEHYQYGKTND